ncbi:MAG TPA: SDR family NAD(P)-dependent oxidoreductase [Alphaproteobacteria bacterium]|nr:SDR family NAD(P)-dependent oxidoreductase [Alphaproteobacteria bacterium]
MTAEFAGQTVMITGAAGNLGRATDAAFSAAGARRVLLDVDRETLVRAFGGEKDDRFLVAADLLNAGDVAQAVEAALARFGRIHVLCNLAGGFKMGHPVHETPESTWRLMIGLNVESIINTARAVVPGMLEAGSGKIVNVAAMAGTSGRAMMAAYGASKSAVIRLTESMAAELGARGVNVNCVMPSILDTPQNRAAMPAADPARWVSPDALAEVILFLASNRSRAIHGAAVPVVGLS